MSHNVSRRSVVAGSGIAITGLLGVGSQVLADEHEIPVIIAEVNPQQETVVLENIGNEAVDLGGYQLDWEHADDQSQVDAFDQGVTIEAGARLVVWTGFQSTQISDVEYDHQIADYNQGRINDDDPDVIAFLSPSGEVVATSDGEIQPPEPESSEGDDSEGEEPEEAPQEEEQEDEEPQEESESQEEDEEAEEESQEEGEETEEESAEEDEEAEGEEPEEEDDAEAQEDDEVSAEDVPEQYEAHLTGAAHGVETEASGNVMFEVDAHDDEMDAHYELTVENICDVTQAHIHLGAEGEDGPVVVWLYPEQGQEPELIEGRFSGRLAEGIITPDDFVGEWDGADFEDAATAFEEGGAYVNVHTEEHPGGEIRGQIEPAGDS